MPNTTIGFAVAERDLSRLEHLSEVFGAGNRSAFLRTAMSRMEAVERAQQLMALQAYGAARTEAAGLSEEDPLMVVRRVLDKRSSV